jgi:hypothetical protein
MYNIPYIGKYKLEIVEYVEQLDKERSTIIVSNC